ncbi:MAG TPA: hypothetical protein VF326_05230 [Anaerolineaceae bacterium]|jgi:molecular chaperone GrpE (heat shock protein)
MFKPFSRLFKKSPPVGPDQASLLSLQSQVQSLKLELEESNKTIRQLNETLERSHSQAAASAQDKADVRLEALYTTLSGPVSQLLTQAELIDGQGKAIPAQDVLVLVKKIIKGLQENGLTLSGQIGQIAVFNPDLHAPVSSDSPLSPGDEVRIRFAGVNYKGRLLRKALVDPAPKV